MVCDLTLACADARGVMTIKEMAQGVAMMVSRVLMFHAVLVSGGGNIDQIKNKPWH